MKKIISTLAFTFTILALYGQADPDTLWKFNGVASLNFSQMTLTNWAAGGENSLSGNGRLNLSADYKDRREVMGWDNELILGYGLIKQGEDDPVRKSDDKIELSSKYGYKASKAWFYSALLNFRTQFDAGYANPGELNSKISNFMAPGYLNLSFGMDYKPSKRFTILLAPVTGKMTIVTDEDLNAEGAFGVDPGKQVRSEFGGYVKIAFTYDIMKNVRINTKVDLFSNYLENPQYVDINFDLLLSLKVNDYISASFISQLIYDYDIKFDVLDENGDATGEVEPRIQFKELFGVGLTYAF